MVGIGFIVALIVAVVAGVREWRRLGRPVQSTPTVVDVPRTTPRAPVQSPRAPARRSTPDPWVDPGLFPPPVVRLPVVDGAPEMLAVRIRPVLLTSPPRDLPLLPPHVEGDGCDDLASECSDFPWWDDSRCWGCDKSCKRRAFRPYSGGNIGAEIRGAGAQRSRNRAEEPYNDAAHTPRKRQVGRTCSGDVDRLWSDWCETCGELVRRVLSGEEPAPGAAVVAVAEADDCPF